MHILFLSCLKATELIEKKLHVQLSTKEKVKLTLHKSMCSACRLYDKQSHILDEALKTHNKKDVNINIEELKLDIKQKISQT